MRRPTRSCRTSIVSNIAEGFGQGTDRAFAKYLYVARGSAEEVRSHLVSALARGHVDAETCRRFDAEAIELFRMMSGLIRLLLRSDRKDRD